MNDGRNEVQSDFHFGSLWIRTRSPKAGVAGTPGSDPVPFYPCSSAAPCWCCSRALPWPIARRHRSDPPPLAPQRKRSLRTSLGSSGVAMSIMCRGVTWGFRSQRWQCGNKCPPGATVSSFSCLVWTFLKWWQWVCISPFLYFCENLLPQYKHFFLMFLFH